MIKRQKKCKDTRFKIQIILFLIKKHLKGFLKKYILEQLSVKILIQKNNGDF